MAIKDLLNGLCKELWARKRIHIILHTAQEVIVYSNVNWYILFKVLNMRPSDNNAALDDCFRIDSLNFRWCREEEHARIRFRRKGEPLKPLGSIEVCVLRTDITAFSDFCKAWRVEAIKGIAVWHSMYNDITSGMLAQFYIIQHEKKGFFFRIVFYFLCL